MSMAQPGVVAPWRAAYVPGDWYVVAGPTSVVVLQPGPGRGDMIADLWADVVASSSMSDLVDRLAGYGITELPDLAVVFWSTAGMRSLVRGGVRLDDPRSGDQVAAGAGVVTWNEVGLEHLESVRIVVGESSGDGEPLPLAVGVVRAGTVVLRADEEAVVRSPQPLLRSAAARASAAVAPVVIGAGAHASASSDAPASDSPGSLRDDSDRSAPEVDTVDAAEATAEDRSNGPEESSEPVDDVSDDRRDDSGPDFPAVPQDDDSGPDFPPVASGDDGEPETGESPAFALNSEWGPQPESQASGGVGAPAASGVAAAGALAPGTAGSTGVAGSTGAAALGSPSPVGPGSGGPGAGGPGAGGPGVLGPASPPGEFSLEQFEMENDDTQLMANPIVLGPDGQVVGSAAPAMTEPMVEAVRCPNGHPNAPGSTACRVCRAALAGAPIQMIPEPLIARLRAADGTVVDLDRAVLLGRAPSEQRSTVPLPRLVTLASPGQDISRTHLQVVPENWQVVVTDLHSTNGTFVVDPGPGGNRGLLPPGQPTPVPIGAVLELGEGVTLTIEPGD